MTNSEDINIQNFQTLIENYEATLESFTEELDAVQNDQQQLKLALSENNELRDEFHKLLSSNAKGDIEYTFKECDFIENLKSQLKSVVEEKNHTVQLWENANNAVEKLEAELRIYKESTQEFVPKKKFLEVKSAYEQKINNLQGTLTQTKNQLEQVIQLKARELKIKDQEIIGSLESQNNTITIIKNLEDEVLKLQKRLNEANHRKAQLEKELQSKKNETDFLQQQNKECKRKVEEALQVVEAALNEKDAALLRETEAKSETDKVTKTLNEFMDETEAKITNIKGNYEIQLKQFQQYLQTTNEVTETKDLEIRRLEKKCVTLEQETEILKSCSKGDDTSKILIMEKNLENTFQKLLLSEKQNIQLKGEVDSIKNDLNQMSHFYERDITLRETEKGLLKNEISNLKKELNACSQTIALNNETINELNKTMHEMEINFTEKLTELRNSLQQSCIERQEMESLHKELVQELQNQLSSQSEINKKWRTESKMMTEQLEKVIAQQKCVNTKLKQEMKGLHEKLKRANITVLEYRKFLEMISHDVSKITTVT